jgi:predicted Fe-Mo cluster-binding NifX family protein
MRRIAVPFLQGNLSLHFGHCDQFAVAAVDPQNEQKISGQWVRGPVLLRRGHSQVALGLRMVSRVLVRIVGEKK